MIDTLVAMKPAVESSQFLESISLEHDSHAMVTLHRPSNVDDPATLGVLLNELLNVAQKMDLIGHFTLGRKPELRVLAGWRNSSQTRRFTSWGRLDILISCTESCIPSVSLPIVGDSRRDDLAWCTLHHLAPKYRTSNHRHTRNQCTRYSRDASNGIRKN